MAGKNKNKKHSHSNKNNSSTNNYAPKLSEQDLCDLVTEATQIHVLLNERYEKLKKSQNFVYILSTKWLRDWKDYVGYQGLFSDDKEDGKKTGKKRPGPPNTDLVASNKSILQIPQQLQQYTYLNTVISDKMSQNDDYIAITQQLWQQFNGIYGPGTQIKRPCRLTKSKRLHVDSQLLKCDFIFVNYGMDDFQNKLQHVKANNKNSIQNFIPFNTVQLSAIWQTQDLYTFLSKLCLVKYNIQNITLWLCDNYLGTYSYQQNIIKALKNKTYEVNAYKILIEDYQDLDIEDFLKQQYTIIVQIGQSKLKSCQLPQQIFGYCETCFEKRTLSYNCLCNRKHYCKRQCQVDDQVYHFSICKHTFSNPDDQQYDSKKLSGIQNNSKCGLKNLGNTCYMNSSLQMFLGIDFIVDYLTSNKYKNAISEKQKDGQMFLKYISKFCKQMYQQTKLGFALQPWDIKGQINYFLPPFKGYKQHDAIDFFMGFINTINDCIKKPDDQAYCNLIKQNLLGQFDSLVICPQCNNQVKNIQCFTQLTLPLKTKTKKILYNYVLFDNPTTYKYGKAQVKQTWNQIKSEVGVAQDCLIYGGADNQAGFSDIDFDSECQNVMKKFKKQLLFYPFVKVKEGDLVFSANFITFKSMSGYNMRANSGYPFPVLANSKKTIGHFILSIIQAINISPNLQIIRQMQQKYDSIMKVHKQQQQKLKQQQKQQASQSEATKSQIKTQQQSPKKQQTQQSNSTTTASSIKNSKNKKQQTKQQVKQQQTKQQSKLQKQLLQLNNQLQSIMQQLKLKIFIEDYKKIRNICFFCKRKCDGCVLSPDFRTSIEDSLSFKVGEARIYIHAQQKPQPIKIKQDLAISGDPSLKDCITLFGQPEKLDEQNAWWCNVCEDMRLALKQLHISKYPKYLILQLSRFKNGQNGKVKNNQPISYNQYEIFDKNKYRLLSVIVHEGSIQGGHYWAICRRGDEFYIFNDDKVSKTDKICHKNAYILCYKREEQENDKQKQKIIQGNKGNKYKIKQKQHKQQQIMQKQSKKSKKNKNKKAQQ